MSVFMLNVLNYITVSRAVCKVYLRKKKESYIQKSNVPFSFLSLFIILPIEHKISRDQLKIFLMKIIERWNIEISSSLRNIYLGKVSFFTSIFDLFSVYIYTHAPKFKLTCWKTSINSDTLFSKKDFSVLIKTNKISKN